MSTYTSMFCTYEYYNNKHRPPDKTFHSLASDREAFNLISSSTLIMNNAPPANHLQDSAASLFISLAS